MEDNNQNVKEVSNNKNKGLIIFVVIAIIVFFIICIGYKNNNNGENTITTRKATTNDLTITSTLNLSALGEDIVLVPKYNIDNLVLTLKFVDKNDKILSTKKHNVGNVKEGQTYNITISLAEFSFTTALKIDSTIISVYSGTTYLI